MPPDTLPKQSRRYSERTPAARCREPGCPWTLNGRGPEFAAEVTAHMLGSSHTVEVITSATAILAPPEGSSR